MIEKKQLIPLLTKAKKQKMKKKKEKKGVTFHVKISI
jgi:hypothetical protein